METTYATGGEGITVTPQGWGQDTLPQDSTNLVARAFLHFASLKKLPFPSGLNIRSQNGIPIGSGLGSSAAAIVSGLLAAREYYSETTSMDEIANMALSLEGHADNTTAALLGGLVVLTVQEGEVIYRRLPAARLPVVVVRPEFILSTRAARKVLPRQVSFKHAVSNLGNTALLIEALRSGDTSLLGKVCRDHLHQPNRLPLIPGASQAVQAGLDAGAAAVVLSGAGSSLLSFTPCNQEEVAIAMQEGFKKAGLESQAFFGWTADKAAQVLNS
jgi:homoserine kinase